MSFSLRRILLPTAFAVPSILAVLVYYFYVIFRKQEKALINAGDRLKKNFNNYEVNNYIYKLDRQKKLSTSRGITDSVMEVYNMVASSNEIDISLKAEMRTVLRSKGIDIK